MILHARDGLKVDTVIQFRDDRSTLGTDPKERQANQFAAALLMPAESIDERVKDALDSGVVSRDALASRLAQEFDVSIEAMTYRLINLGILRG